MEPDLHGVYMECLICGNIVDDSRYAKPLPILRGPDKEMSKLRLRLRPRHEAEAHGDDCEACRR